MKRRASMCIVRLGSLDGARLVTLSAGWPPRCIKSRRGKHAVPEHFRRVVGLLLLSLSAALTAGAPVASATSSLRPGCPLGADPYRSSQAVLTACGDRLLPRKSLRRLPEGGSESTYDMPGGTHLSISIPPSSFDPSTASNAALERYNLPEAPPTGSPEYAKWKQMIDRPLHFATPPSALIEVPAKAVEPGSSLAAPQTPSIAPAATFSEGESRTWAGYMDWGGGSRTESIEYPDFSKATGYFYEPALGNTSGCSEEPAGLATWVGIGGWEDNNTGLAQVGVIQAVSGEGAGGVLASAGQGFFETVQPGKLGEGYEVAAKFIVPAHVWVKAEVREVSKNTYDYFLENLKTGEVWPAKDKVQKGETAAGDKTAEYIVERPGGKGLYKFSSIPFQGFTNNEAVGDFKHERIEGRGAKPSEPDDLPSNLVKDYEFAAKWSHCKKSEGEEEETVDNGGPSTPAPSATTGVASEVTETTARLTGTVDPEGASTNYHIEYGIEAENYEWGTEPRQAGSREEVVAASESVHGLMPGTTYHYRVIANSPRGVGAGTDRTFKTPGIAPPPAPTVSTEGSSTIKARGANVEATVDPNGAETHYYFQYGTSPGLYGSAAPAEPGEVLTGSSPEKVTVGLTGLADVPRDVANGFVR
jgi:Peptidase A4 family